MAKYFAEKLHTDFWQGFNTSMKQNTHSTFTCSMLTIEILEQGVKYVKS